MQNIFLQSRQIFLLAAVDIKVQVTFCLLFFFLNFEVVYQNPIQTNNDTSKGISDI